MSSTAEPTLKLNTGASIPQIGLGTWQSPDQEAYNAVVTALKNGYRHIDTAAIYGNEEAVGRGIRDSGVPRKEIFVTTKLWGTQQRNPEAALDDSLKRLGLDYVDLYLIHWPVALKTDSIKDGNVFTFPRTADGKIDVDIEDWDFTKTWEKMQHLPKTGKTKAIGVSNFSIKNIEALFKANPNTIVPAANQVETHPQLDQQELLDYCKSKGILLEAYSPLGSSNSLLLTDPTIKKIAEKHNVEPANILINWGLSRGYVVLPKSVNPERVKNNKKIIDLPAEDIETINSLATKIGSKRYVSPDFTPFKIFE
ncbi:NADPH-dependent aldo-keto reductase [Kluyveromyces marxianus]|nr:NADPH-dependent aldo-keto reductase [Kluyveromyces marxianus]KAG0680856.1 NADPH-dependent aldo-keto reductase [Kluyveromyces marxianus]